MSVKSAQVTVTTSATPLDQANTSDQVATLMYNRGTAAVFVGNSAVTTATGLQVDPGESVSVASEVTPSGLHAICASGTVACHVLQVGV